MTTHEKFTATQKTERELALERLSNRRYEELLAKLGGRKAA